MFFWPRQVQKNPGLTWGEASVVHAWYEEYGPDTDFSKYADKKIVLFFHADWCSTCKIIENDILEKWVPEGVHMFEVNFDTESELLEKYDIRSQSSFAYIDPNWELIKRRVWGFGIDDVITKLEDTEEKPREKVRAEKEKEEIVNEIKNQENLDSEINTDWWSEGIMVDTTTDKDTSTSKYAYFAWGCFWCLEWPYEAKEWVLDVVSGYAWWDEQTANYKTVSWWQTKHRESVRVEYNPSIIPFEDLVEHFWYQIDPTDAGGQFADRGFHYTTAIYYSTDEEKQIAETSKKALEDSGKFEEAIEVRIEPFSTFFLAEEDHQDYYLKQSAHYKRYKKWSGREDFIEDNWIEWEEIIKPKPKLDINSVETELENIQINLEWSDDKSPGNFQWWIWEEGLDDLQRKVVFEQWTEPPFDNKYWDHKEDGIYVDILDGTPLFSSTDKFDSWTWRPSFTTPIDVLLIGLEEDKQFGMVRTEVETTNNTHLGHVFDDGPDWAQRYCINSAALDFVPLEKMEEMGYGEYLVLFE